MRISCNSLNRSSKSQAIWIAIYCSILIPSMHQGSTHSSLSAAIIAGSIILGSTVSAWVVCRKPKPVA